jgi:hypothetical protein
MDNLKQPSFPYIEYDKAASCAPGFTKLEYASLLIAQGYIANGAYKNDEQEGYEIARCSVNVAKLVLEEANK